MGAEVDVSVIAGVALLVFGIIVMTAAGAINMVVRSGAVGPRGRYNRSEESRLARSRPGIASALLFALGMALLVAGIALSIA